MFRALANRPYLLAAAAVGLALYFVTGPWISRPIARVLVGWDTGVATFLISTSIYMGRSDPARLIQRAQRHDLGRRLVLVVTILAAVASVGALVAELSQSKSLAHSEFHVVLAAMTVVLSWLFVQIVFAMHYAHEYYRLGADGKPIGGLSFGPEGEPDYWDFVHFAFILGACSQTADVSFASRPMRRTGTLHTLVAFAFNTAILATMINIAAGLF